MSREYYQGLWIRTTKLAIKAIRRGNRYRLAWMSARQRAAAEKRAAELWRQLYIRAHDQWLNQIEETNKLRKELDETRTT